MKPWAEGVLGQVRPETHDKRSHAVAMADSWAATEGIKKARVLQQVPTDASLPDGCAEPDVESFLAGS